MARKAKRDKKRIRKRLSTGPTWVKHLRTRYELAELEPTLYSWTIPDCACRMSVSAWIAHALPACLPWTRLQAHLLRIPPVKLVGTSIRGPAIVYTIAAASVELS